MIQITLRHAEKQNVYAGITEWLTHCSESVNALEACKDIGDVLRIAMVIRIKKKLYFKPRRCPVCRRMRLFVRCPLARCCKKCHERQRRISRMAERKRQRKAGVYKYNSHYKSIRKKALKEHPYCSLCGSEIRLTVHHVGGVASIIQYYAMIAIKHTNAGIINERQQYARRRY